MNINDGTTAASAGGLLGASPADGVRERPGGVAVGGGKGARKAISAALAMGRLKEVGGGGDSLFRAVSTAIHGTAEAHAQLRQAVCEELREREGVYAAFMAAEEGRKSGAYAEYVKTMATKGTGGDELAMQVLARITDRVIGVLSVEDGVVKAKLLGEGKGERVWLAYVHRHYEVVKPEDGEVLLDECITVERKEHLGPVAMPQRAHTHKKDETKPKATKASVALALRPRDWEGKVVLWQGQETEECGVLLAPEGSEGEVDRWLRTGKEVTVVSLRRLPTIPAKETRDMVLSLADGTGSKVRRVFVTSLGMAVPYNDPGAAAQVFEEERVTVPLFLAMRTTKTAGNALPAFAGWLKKRTTRKVEAGPPKKVDGCVSMRLTVDRADAEVLLRAAGKDGVFVRQAFEASGNLVPIWLSGLELSEVAKCAERVGSWGVAACKALTTFGVRVPKDRVEEVRALLQGMQCRPSLGGQDSWCVEGVPKEWGKLDVEAFFAKANWPIEAVKKVGETRSGRAWLVRTNATPQGTFIKTNARMITVRKYVEEKQNKSTRSKSGHAMPAFSGASYASVLAGSRAAEPASGIQAAAVQPNEAHTQVPAAAPDHRTEAVAQMPAAAPTPPAAPAPQAPRQVMRAQPEDEWLKAFEERTRKREQEAAERVEAAEKRTQNLQKAVESLESTITKLNTELKGVQEEMSAMGTMLDRALKMLAVLQTRSDDAEREKAMRGSRVSSMAGALIPAQPAPLAIEGRNAKRVPSASPEDQPEPVRTRVK